MEEEEEEEIEEEYEETMYEDDAFYWDEYPTYYDDDLYEDEYWVRPKFHIKCSMNEQNLAQLECYISQNLYITSTSFAVKFSTGL